MRSMSAAVLVALLLLVAPRERVREHDGDLREYARGTWASFVAMTDERSGLPADSLHHDGTRSVQTSTTNIGAYMWSAVVAHRLGLISRFELVKRLSKTLATLKGMERSDGGQYWNWYDHRTGEKLDYWPPNPGGNFRNWLSSVDNGWLAVGLRVVENSVPELSKPAGELYKAMDFGIYYVPERNLVRFHIVPGDPNNSLPAVTTRPSARAGSSTTSASRDASCRRRPTSSAGGRSPTTCDWAGWRRAGRRRARLLRRQGVRGRVPVP